MRKMNNMISKYAGLLGVSVVLGVSACAPIDPETGTFVDRATPETTSMEKQINVQKLTPVFVVKFDRGSNHFSDMEKGRLIGFMQAQQAKFGDVLYLELPPFTDADSINEGRYGFIGSFLEEEHFQVVPKILKDGLADSLRIYFTKYIATIDPACAKGWHKPVGNDYENLPLPHLGCATASGLAQMVEDPKDLIDPGSMGGYDGERAAISIAKYRTGVTSESSEGEDSSGGSETTGSDQ